MKQSILRILPLLAAVLILSAVSCRKEKKADYIFEAVDFYGEYNGSIGTDGEHNYYIHLSDKGFDSEGRSLPEGTYYRFDFFSSAPSSTDRITIPAGQYVLGSKGASVQGTFTPEHSLYFVNGSSGNSEIQVIFSYGTLEITCEGDTYSIEADLTDITGMTHHISYKGPAELTDNSMHSRLDYLPLGTDLHMESDSLIAVDYGTVNGFHNIILSITDMPSDDSRITPPGSILNMDCYMSVDEYGILPGRYELSEVWGIQDYSISPGEESNGQYVGSTVEYFEQDSSLLGLIESGMLDLKRFESDSLTTSFTMDFEFITASSDTIRGTYSGPITLSETPLATLPASVSANTSSRPVFNPITRSHFSLSR